MYIKLCWQNMGLFFNIAKIQLKIAYIPLKKIVRISQYNIGTPHLPKLKKKNKNVTPKIIFFISMKLNFQLNRHFWWKKKLKNSHFIYAVITFFAILFASVTVLFSFVRLYMHSLQIYSREDLFFWTSYGSLSYDETRFWGELANLLKHNH